MKSVKLIYYLRFYINGVYHTLGVYCLHKAKTDYPGFKLGPDSREK